MKGSEFITITFSTLPMIQRSISMCKIYERISSTWTFVPCTYTKQTTLSSYYLINTDLYPHTWSHFQDICTLIDLCPIQLCSDHGWLFPYLSRLLLWHEPLARYVKLQVAHVPGMPGSVSPSPQISDPDMHQGTCVTHVPWCMPGSLTSGFVWSRVAGKTIPAFPTHAQPVVLRIGQEAHWAIMWLLKCQCHNPDHYR